MSRAPVEGRLEAVLTRLATMRGREDPTPDWSDEHERWWLYREALDDPQARDLLLEAARIDPDVLVASSIAMEMIERLEVDPAPWVAAMPAGSHQEQLTAQRAADVRVLRDVVMRRVAPTEAEVAGWSDWLRRRLAAECTVPEVPLHLSMHGRTSRVRRQSRDRARQLSGRVTAERRAEQ